MLGSMYTTIPAHDLERARRFYAEKLDLHPMEERPDGLMYEAFLLYQTPSAGSAQHTLAGWVVENIDEAVAVLRDNGVVFEEYDFPGLKTVDGIADMNGSYAAWFKDSEGNILALTQFA